MKKKLFFTSGVLLALATVTYSSYYASSDSVVTKDAGLLMANVEALSDEEGSSAETWSCWSNVKNGSGVWVCGAPCMWLANKNAKSGEGLCKK